MKLSLLFLLLFQFSCRNTPEQAISFKTEWPKNINPSYFKTMLDLRKDLLLVLNLSDISTGVDSFELRFGYNGIFVGQDLFVIKFQNNKWQGFHYYYEQKSSLSNSEEDLNYASKLTDLRDTFSIQKPFNPLITWNNLIDSISHTEILNIPSQGDLKGYRNRIADGYEFWLEYSTKHKFKYIRYENPDRYKEFKESKIVLDFIDMFNRNIRSEDICWPRCIAKK